MTRKAMVKKISLPAAILMIFFLVAVCMYQTVSTHNDLATDLAIAFSNFRNNIGK